MRATQSNALKGCEVGQYLVSVDLLSRMVELTCSRDVVIVENDTYFICAAAQVDMPDGGLGKASCEEGSKESL